MKTSEQLDKLAPAMAKAQSEMGGAAKDTTNPFFGKKYADLTSVWEACKYALHSNGFSVIQSPIDREGRIGVSTLLLHSSGQYVMDEYTLAVKKENDPQADGSALTYSRRYALAAFVGVCPVDDDGEDAMARKKKEDTEKKRLADIQATKDQDEKPKTYTAADYIAIADKESKDAKSLDAWYKKWNQSAEKNLNKQELHKFNVQIDGLRAIFEGAE